MRAGQTPILVGRDDELAQCARAAVVLISGEPGIGKTRLAQELGERARADGACVVWGRAWEGEGTPAYWPWLEVLRALRRDDRTRDDLERASNESAELRSLLGGVAVRGEASGAFRLLDAVTGVLRAIAGRLRLAVVIDDLHAADSASLELFVFVARAVREGGGDLQLIGTTRDLAFATDDVRRMLSRIAREAFALPLRRLTRDEVAVWIQRVAPSLEARAEQLFANSDGNPLFVGELIAAWRGGAPVPSRTFAIDDAIRAHVALLSERARDVLARASVLGRNLDRAALLAVGAGTDGIDEAVASALLVADGEQLRFAHTLVREELYAELASDRRVELHRLAATHFAAEPERALPHVLGAASVVGGDAIVRVTLDAMHAAMGRLAFADAAATGTRVLHELGAALTGVQGAELRVAIGEALVAAGEPDLGRETCLAAANVAGDAGDASLFARAALAYASESRVGRHPTSIRLLRQALARDSELSPKLRVLVRARLATAIIPPTVEEGDEPLRLAREALAEARRLGDEEAHLAAVSLILSTFPQELSLAERLSLAAEAIPLARRLGQLARVVSVLGWQIASWLEMGQLEAARKQAEACCAVIREMPPHHAWRAELMTAFIAALDGRFEDAAAIARAMVDTGHPEARHQGAIVLMGLPYLHGNADAFRDDYARCMGALAATPGSEIFLSIADATVGNADRVRLALAKARAINLASLPGASQLGWPAVILGLRDEAAPFLRHAIAAAERTPLLFGPNAFMTMGPADLLAARIAHLTGDVELAHEHLARARAFVEQLGAPGLLRQLAITTAVIGTRPIEPSVAQQDASAPAVLEKRGELWAIRGAGREILVEHRRGLDYLATLVAAPHCDIHVLDLAGIQEDSDAGVLLDDRAKRAYRERAESLREQLAEAERFADLGRAEAARHELEALASELARALGLGSRDRRAGSTVERARINVQRRLRDVVRRIAELDAGLGRHFDLSLKTGAFCRYAPTWEQSFQGSERR